MKDFSKLSRGEKAFAMNEVIESLNVETAYYSDWLNEWPDGATIEEAKDDFDIHASDSKEDRDSKESLWETLERKFRIRVEMFGCEDGRSIQEEDVVGLWVPKTKNPEYEEDERGGGFAILKGEEGKLNRVRKTLEELGYPLTPTEEGKNYHSFFVDWRKWRLQKAVSFILKSAEWLSQEECGCCTIRLTKNTQLAVGWANGFDPDDKTIIHSKTQPEWAIAVAVKSLEGDDLKTDLEWLTTPYVAEGEDKGLVFSQLEWTLSPTGTEDDARRAFSYLMSQLDGIIKGYRLMADGRCLLRK